jgi:hypothetical protein
VTPSFTWRQFYNPYACRQAAEGPGAGIAFTTRPVVNDDNRNMGIQSQNRDGSIKACKKASTKRKGKGKGKARPSPRDHQLAVPIFMSWQHCKVCKAERLFLTRGEKITIPHRAHHVRCPRNRTTRGASTTTTMVTSERDSISLMLTNRAGFNTPLGRRLNAQMPSVNFLRPYPYSIQYLDRYQPLNHELRL